MKFLLFKSESVAEEVAWQLRAISIRKLVILLQTDPQALKLAIALAGGKRVKNLTPFPFIAIIGLLLLVYLKISVQINQPDKLKIFTEDRLTRLHICNNKSLDNLRQAIGCDDQPKSFEKPFFE